MPARHRLSNWLLRHEVVYSDGQAWAGAHDAWVRRQRFGLPLVQATFDEGYDSVVTIAAMDADSPWTGTVHRPGCLRGISTLTGFALAVESVAGADSPATPSERSAKHLWAATMTGGVSSRSRDRNRIDIRCTDRTGWLKDCDSSVWVGEGLTGWVGLATEPVQPGRPSDVSR